MNPLAMLRKRQKVLLAVFGVLLMIVFTVGGILSSYMGRQGTTQENGVVVRWKGGELRETEMQRMRIARNQLRLFLQAVMEVTLARGGTPGDPRFQLQGQVRPEYLPFILQSMLPDSEQGIVQTMLMAKAADDSGVVLSEQAVIDYLIRLTDDTVQLNEFAGILSRLTSRRMSQAALIDTLRHHLKAWHMQDLVRSGVFPATPGAAWQLYRQLNERVQAQVTPFSASQFVSQVTAPTEDEIRETFENYKDQLPSPASPEPGFKLPKRAAFEYVIADRDKFLQEVKGTVTDQEVETYYQEHREEFKRFTPSGDDSFEPSDLDLPGPGLEDLQPPANPTPPADETDAEPQSGDPTDEQSDSAPQQTPSDQPDAQTSPEQPEAEDSGYNRQPSDEPLRIRPVSLLRPLQESADESPDAGQDQGAGGGQSGEGAQDPAVPTDSPADTPAPDSNDPQSSAEGQNDDPQSSAAEPSPADDVPPAEDEAPAGPGQNETAPGDANTEATGQPDATEGSGAAGEQPEGTGAAVDQEPAEYRSLEEVAETIRDRLAAPLVEQRMSEALNAIRTKMQAYYAEQYLPWQIAREQKVESTPEQPPARPDLKAAAAELGLEYGQVPLVGPLEVQEYPLGKAQTFDVSGGFSMVSFVEVAYSDEFARFQPEEMFGEQLGSRFLFWKVDEAPERVPQLEEARDKVIEAIRLQRAFEVALEKSKELAKQVNESGKSLKELVGDSQPVTETGEFTWLTSGNTGTGRPMLSTVSGVEMAGAQFMEDVFSVQPGNAVSTFNQPKTEAYVVFVQPGGTDEAALRNGFVRTGLQSSELQTLATMQVNQVVFNWYQQLRERYDLTWVRDPQEM